MLESLKVDIQNLQQQSLRNPLEFSSALVAATPPYSPSIGNDISGGEDVELPMASPEQPNKELGVPFSIDAPTKDHNGDENQ